jgi:hypothetical protein
VSADAKEEAAMPKRLTREEELKLAYAKLGADYTADDYEKRAEFHRFIKSRSPPRPQISAAMEARIEQVINDVEAGKCGEVELLKLIAEVLGGEIVGKLNSDIVVP